MNRRQHVPRFFKFALRTVAGLAIYTSMLSGQETVSSYAQPTLIKTLQIVPPNQSLSHPFWVDQTACFSLTVSSLIKNLGIRLVDPIGLAYVYGQTPSESFTSNIYPDPQALPDAPGAHYYLNIENPVKGQWRLNINAPDALPSIASIPLQINFNNQVAPVLFGGGGYLSMGSNVSFGVAVLDGTTKVGNLQIDATLLRLDDPMVPSVQVVFADDGQGADYLARDSIYSTFITPTQSGSYMLQVEVSGDASTGHFQRSCATGFKMAAKNASITGNFTVRPRVGVPK